MGKKGRRQDKAREPSAEQEKGKLNGKVYETELKRLHVELVRLSNGSSTKD